MRSDAVRLKRSEASEVLGQVGVLVVLSEKLKNERAGNLGHGLATAGAARDHSNSNAELFSALVALCDDRLAVEAGPEPPPTSDRLQGPTPGRPPNRPGLAHQHLEEER